MAAIPFFKPRLIKTMQFFVAGKLGPCAMIVEKLPHVPGLSICVVTSPIGVVSVISVGIVVVGVVVNVVSINALDVIIGVVSVISVGIVVVGVVVNVVSTNALDVIIGVLVAV
jgi:hypothetical protein